MGRQALDPSSLPPTACLPVAGPAGAAQEPFPFLPNAGPMLCGWLRDRHGGHDCEESDASA